MGCGYVFSSQYTDFDKAVSIASRAAFTNQGQICLCGSRIFIEEKIYNKFRDALIAKASKLIVLCELNNI